MPARLLVVIVAYAATTLVVPDIAFAQRSGRGGGGGTAAPRGGGSGPRGGVAPRSGPSGPRGPAVGAGTRRVSGGAPIVGRAVPRGAVHGVRPGGRSPIYYGGRYLRGYPAFGYYGWGSGWGAWGNWWGPGWYGSMWWPGWGWWGPPGPFYGVPYGVTSDARLLVTPRETEVYVDGALAGMVDSYDGVFQSLRLAPGTHEISLYLDGHRRFTRDVYVAPGATLKVRHTMEPLPAGAPADERPTPPVRPEPTESPAPQTTVSGPRRLAPPARARSREATAGEAGALAIRVQPADAEILIDGQRWQAPEDVSAPLEIRVPAGRVRVEIRKPGHAPFSTEVTVEPGVVTPLNVSLPARDPEI